MTILPWNYGSNIIWKWTKLCIGWEKNKNIKKCLIINVFFSMLIEHILWWFWVHFYSSLDLTMFVSQYMLGKDTKDIHTTIFQILTERMTCPNASEQRASNTNTSIESNEKSVSGDKHNLNLENRIQSYEAKGNMHEKI